VTLKLFALRHVSGRDGFETETSRSQDVQTSRSRLGQVCQRLGLEKLGFGVSLGLEMRPGIVEYLVRKTIAKF